MKLGLLSPKPFLLILGEDYKLLVKYFCRCGSILSLVLISFSFVLNSSNITIIQKQRNIKFDLRKKLSHNINALIFDRLTEKKESFIHYLDRFWEAEWKDWARPSWAIFVP